MQYGYLLTAQPVVGEHRHCVAYVVLVAHTGRHYHRFAERGYFFYKRIVGYLSRRYFPQSEIERVQKVKALHVECRRPESDAFFAAVCNQFVMVCLRQLKTLQHSQLRVVAVTDVALLIVGLFRILRHQPLRLERLKLDNVNACLGSRVDKSFCRRQRAVVVHARLGDYKCMAHFFLLISRAGLPA